MIEYQIKKLNKEKTITQLLQIDNIKNISVLEDMLIFNVRYFKRRNVEKMLKQKNIEILKKTPKGFCWLYSNTIKRIGIIIPIILFVIFLFVSNMFVFRVEILGNEYVTSEDITKVLDELQVLGIKNKFNINTENIENEIMKLEMVSLVSVIVKGNTLIVSIKEKVYNSEYVDRDKFTPLISSFNGTITEISLIQGTPVVKVGQTVKKGQILVDAYTIDTNGQKLAVKPMADIKADVFVTTTLSVPNTKINMVDTGNTIKQKQIECFGVQIFSSLNDCDFKYYRKEEKKEVLNKNILFPIYLYEVTYYEQEKNIIENYYLNNSEQILNDCKQKTRQLVANCEIIKDEYTVVSQMADINQITHTIIVNKSIC